MLSNATLDQICSFANKTVVHLLNDSIVASAVRSRVVRVLSVQNTGVGVCVIRRSHANNVGPPVGEEYLSHV